jgi:alkylation response protein AidB-like acyl-CoA dehydrogenase
MAEFSESELRERVRQLIADVDADDRVAFRGAQFDRGLAWVHFPEGKGGLGLSPKAQTVVQDELRGASRVYDDIALNPIGIGMAAPVLLAFGSPEMHDRFLRRIFTGEDIWCQMFSEPGAGSDVASLSTRAVRDGDEWVVNGQKVWTTLAHVSNWGLLVARVPIGRSTRPLC